MAAYISKKLAATILLLQFLLATANAQDLAIPRNNELQLNVTSPIEDYIIQNQRLYDANIVNCGKQLDNFRTNFYDQVNTIYTHSEWLANQLEFIQSKYQPMEALDDVHKHCVQKYLGNIYTTAWVKSTLTSCATSASNYITSILSSPESTKYTLESYYDDNLPSQLDNCKKSHPTNADNYSKCVEGVIDATNTYTITNQKNFAAQMSSSTCSGNTYIRTALECSFTASYNTISEASATTRLIDNCIAGLEFCPLCPSTKKLH